MFNIDKPEVKDERYKDFAGKHNIRKIVEPNGQVRWYVRTCPRLSNRLRIGRFVTCFSKPHRNLADTLRLIFIMSSVRIYERNHSMKCFHIVRYGCRRGIKHGKGHSCSRPRGVGVPPCDLENLADAIKMIMRECEKAGLFCELQEGTLLGRY